MLSLLLACAAPPPEPILSASPASGPSFGYYPVRFDLGESGVEADAVLGLSVAGIAAYDLSSDGDALTATVQGAPTPGPADVELRTADGATVFTGAFTYEAPVDPLFDRMVAVGASLAQGAQSGVVTGRSALAGPMAGLARAAGAYLAIPLFVPDGFRAIAPADVGPPPTCAVPDPVAFGIVSAADALERMVDPDTGEFGFQFLRIDADLAPRNLGVAGYDVNEQVDGPATITANTLSHLVYDPYADFGDPLPRTTADIVAELAPTLIVSPDLIGNDVLDTITDGDTFDVSRATPRDAFQAKLEEVVAGLAATGAEVFVATLPNPSILPIVADRSRDALDAGTMTQDEIDTQLAAISEVTRDYNGLLVAAAAGYPNVHIVDLAAEVDRLAVTPLTANGETFTINRFGGLVSLDGMHFSNTGYARLANLYAEAIHDTLGIDVPEVDLDDVSAADPFAPSALRAAGLDPDACE